MLQPQVDFWTRIFAVYSENQSVVHSMDDVRKVYAVLDFRSEAQTMDAVRLATYKSHEEYAAKCAVEALLKRVSALQATPEAMSPEELRVYRMFAYSSDPHRFLEAIGDVRVQRGLRERTQHALEISGRYLPQMEQIFSSYGLPTRLTRLPLVESSFNLAAYSKVGAAGLWQFIPASARIYMRMNEIADDRRDPWTSTDAAARHLRDDYAVLQNWPLAVTAYNFGRGGLAHALAQINGSTLTDVLTRYDSDRFGFASRNFYAEFLAASDVERNWRKHFGDIKRDAPLPFETVETRDYVPYATLERLSGTDEVLFRSLNPSYNEEVVNGRLYVPPGQIIRVPAGSAEHFRAMYTALGPDQRFDHQRVFYINHQVRRGDSIARLAHRYGVSESDILAVNGLSRRARLRAGQTVRIPPRDYTPAAAPSAPTLVTVADTPETPRAHAVKTSNHPAPAKKSQHMYRVRAGQSLSVLARRFETTVEHLRRLNGLDRGDVLQAGDTIKVP